MRVARPICSLPLILTAILWVACTTTTIRVRPSTPDEARLVNAALRPLLAELADPALYREDCKIALGIIASRYINASAGQGASSPCTTFTLLVTEGAVTRLPEPMLRAVLAHELGHVVLQHRGRKSRENEAAADDFAVKLLKRLEPRYPEACVQLISARHGWPSIRRRSDVPRPHCRDAIGDVAPVRGEQPSHSTVT